jgi:CubicO group peptidase (beta-lactamase class C family)
LLKRRDILGLALLAPWLSGCGGGGGTHWSELPIKTPIKDDDWPTDTPANQGIAAAVMQSLLDEGASHPFLYSVLVVRNGLLIGERYYNGALSSDLRSVASVTKTVSSLLIGQAIADGKIASTSDTLAKLLPAELATTPNPYAAEITLQQLLDMTGGQQWDEGTRQLDATNSPDMTAFALALPAGRQGKNFDYSTAAAHLLSPILRNAYGVDELAVATTKLFEPLGIRQSAWSRDATGMVHGSFGLQLRTRDVMKIGVMALQGGQWHGAAVVPAAWIAKSLAPAVTGLGADGPLTNSGYGNLWWSGTVAGMEVHLAAGFGGQYALLVPQLNLVIASAAELNVTYNTAGSHQVAILNMFARFLLAAKG